MLQVIVRKIVQFYESGNRWWLALLSGLMYPLALPPFNSELHPAFTFFPLISVVALIPLFFLVTRTPLKRALFHTFLFSFSLCLGQFYWIGFVTADGLWILIFVGMFLVSAAVALFYLCAALMFRFFYFNVPRFSLLAFPAAWILIDYFRTLTDISFPWAFLGYSLTGFLPLAQLASITGVWGLTYLIVIGNMLIYELLKSYYTRGSLNRGNKLHFSAWAVIVLVASIWGWGRMGSELDGEGEVKVALLQSYMDQFNWTGNSIDTAFTVTEEMISETMAESKPDLMILPESALLCYLERQLERRRRVQKWVSQSGVPLVVGALHWDEAQEGESAGRRFNVYNSVFLVEPDEAELIPYHKIKLVPFSEAMPFEANFPILSRVNLGGAGFKRGKEETIFHIDDRINGAPFICYEIIYPGFVRNRLDETTNMLINVTNDGWFGRSSGPFQHASMAQMRSIENGISLARSANSGISMNVDPHGRILQKSPLYERVILTGNLPLKRLPTLYSRFGDWVVVFSFLLVVSGVLGIFYTKVRSKNSSEDCRDLKKPHNRKKTSENRVVR
ncbi:apolipoprotein N-acyltransferase [Chitinispirillales bacterium ANBcel5]|uniref:apolipoprotein N-acyltransferase n=1 Tax=Cellulosispirillum alkaliphilum TaxID=3039283 RepID=UPI002A594EC2|nr:apolipoprotein N-acyltransferase [Chitinispirillales bacterium ANBcel5]